MLRFLIENNEKSRKWNKMHMSSKFPDMMESFSFAHVMQTQSSRLSRGSVVLAQHDVEDFFDDVVKVDVLDDHGLLLSQTRQIAVTKATTINVV